MVPFNPPSPPAYAPLTAEPAGPGNGGTSGPADGVDEVIAATVTTAINDLIASCAYNMALVAGPNSAPPVVQPGTLNASSGIARISQASLGSLATLVPADPYSFRFVSGYGLFIYYPDTPYTQDGIYIINSTAGQWINAVFLVRGTTQSGLITGSGGPDNGIAALDTGGHVPLEELPMTNPDDTAIAGTVGGIVPFEELPALDVYRAPYAKVYGNLAVPSAAAFTPGRFSIYATQSGPDANLAVSVQTVNGVDGVQFVISLDQFDTFPNGGTPLQSLQASDVIVTVEKINPAANEQLYVASITVTAGAQLATGAGGSFNTGTGLFTPSPPPSGWTNNEWVNYVFIDSTGANWLILGNTTTALSLNGTISLAPASGAWTINELPTLTVDVGLCDMASSTYTGITGLELASIGIIF